MELFCQRHFSHMCILNDIVRITLDFLVILKLCEHATFCYIKLKMIYASVDYHRSDWKTTVS